MACRKTANSVKGDDVKKMTLRKKMLTVYQKRNQGKIPWAAYGFLLPRGKVERELRNSGCGLIEWYPVSSWLSPAAFDFQIYESEVKDVEISIKTVWEDNEKVLIRTYHTPLGSIYEKIEEDPGYHSNWIKKFLIKSIHDYEIVKFIIENTVYHENYNSFLEAQENLGDDGVVYALADRSPWQKMLLELAGPERLFIDFHDNRTLVEDLLSSIQRKLDEAYRIVADSPAEVIWVPDNITGDLTEPKIFEKYCLSFYNKQGELLHRKNKTLVVHMDGKLNCLKDLIKKADIDVIESFTLPEGGGDLSIEEASTIWKDKSIIANLPAFLCFKEEKVVREYIQKLLVKVSPRKNFILEISEDLPRPFWRNTLPVVADVMQNQ